MIDHACQCTGYPIELVELRLYTTNNLEKRKKAALEYTEWRNFKKVIEKAKTACMGSENDVLNHFVDVNKMVNMGSGSKREIENL